MLEATNIQPQLNVYFLPITFLLRRMTAEYFLFSGNLQATINSIELPEPLASAGKRRD